MATNYSPYETIKSIYDLKKQWDDETKAGNSTGASLAAQNAQQYYDKLKNNGYADVAEQLSKVDYAGAKSILDKYAGTGKTAIRPFFESLSGSTNLSKDEVNNLIKYEDKTGHVSFAGTDIGRPDAVANGVSYWDKDYLKNVWDSYMKDSKANDYNGVKGNAIYSDRMDSATNKSDEQWNQLNEYNTDYTNKSNQAWEVASTPYAQSQELKAAMDYVMPNYIISGNKAAYGAAASGAASNGGNVDTFAAANAMRQRNAQVAQGAEMAYQLGLESYQNRVNNINAFLSNMGMHRESLTNQQNSNIDNDMTLAQMAFDNAETQRNNEHTWSEEKLNNATARKEVDANIELAKNTLAAETSLGMAEIGAKAQRDVDEDSYESTHGVTITPISDTLPASASDADERKVLKGYETSNLNNLSARFINELAETGTTVSIKDVLTTIANRSDAYGLTINDVYSILDYLDLGAYKNYFKQIDKTGRADEPGVMLTKQI